jgi:hypothetical protein
MSITHNYEVSVKWDTARRGTLSSPDLSTTITVATPPQFPNGIPDIWSPEHLFTAAVNSCLMTTFLAIAENFKLEFIKFDSKATGKLEMVDGKYKMSEVILAPMLVIKDENDRVQAEKVLHKSEAACLISNSIISKIIFSPSVTVAEYV